MTIDELLAPVTVPPKLCWPGEVQHLDVGSPVIAIPDAKNEPGMVACMTMAGPIDIPESKLKYKGKL